MSPFDYLVAVALLTSTPESVEPSLTPEAYVRLQPVLQTLAVKWEILDPREVRYVLTRQEDFASDLKLLQRRHRDLSGAPPLHDFCASPSALRSAIYSLSTARIASTSTSDSRWNCRTGGSCERSFKKPIDSTRFGTPSVTPAASITT